jgi:hypothetical protein
MSNRPFSFFLSFFFSFFLPFFPFFPFFHSLPSASPRTFSDSNCKFSILLYATDNTALIIGNYFIRTLYKTNYLYYNFVSFHFISFHFTSPHLYKHCTFIIVFNFSCLFHEKKVLLNSNKSERSNSLFTSLYLFQYLAVHATSLLDFYSEVDKN